MKTALSVLVSSTLMFAGVSVIGCSQEQNPPAAHSGSEGGNGAFGTNPVRPGSYAGENSNQQGVTPTTQPAAGQ